MFLWGSGSCASTSRSDTMTSYYPPSNILRFSIPCRRHIRHAFCYVLWTPRTNPRIENPSKEKQNCTGYRHETNSRHTLTAQSDSRHTDKLIQWELIAKEKKKNTTTSEYTHEAHEHLSLNSISCLSFHSIPTLEKN
jgi:hypothetical protein